MPREPDPTLGDRILDAAQGIWAAGGDEALTMRAVAGAARTTTPTVYARFADRQALLAALRSRAVERLSAAVGPDQTLLDGCGRYLDFAADQPHDYTLLFGDRWPERLSRAGDMRPLDLLQAALSRQRGQAADNHLALALEIWAALHGAASIIMAFGKASPFSEEMRAACLRACERLASAG